MAENQSRQVWVTPELEQIEMVNTATVTGTCQGGGGTPGSKGMMEAENPDGNCSVGS